MYDDFFAFARKRHQIYLDRKAGLPAPWTDDPILQQYSFTNVFRELDKTTVWFRENVRDKHDRTNSVLMATVVFRLFNRMTTGEAIFCQPSLLTGETAFITSHFKREDGDEAYTDPMRQAILAACGKGPYCTGSYIINSPNGMDKLTGVLQMIQWVWDEKEDILRVIKEEGTLEATWARLCKFPHIAAFTSYEIVTDLRHTHLLDRAPDIMTWANAGPGAMRGLNRIHGRPLNMKAKSHPFIAEMQDIMVWANGVGGDWPDDYPALEMRDVEHTLCEFDKYTRTKQGEGRPRGRFKST